MKTNPFQRIGLILAILFSLTLFAAAQNETTGSISGTITDSTGAVIKGCHRHPDQYRPRRGGAHSSTNSSGFYTATSLPLGTYTVKVSANGFKTEVMTGLVLHANDALTVNRTLVPGAVSETVSVTADQAQLNLSECGIRQGLINGTQINELAMVNNRNYEQPDDPAARRRLRQRDRPACSAVPWASAEPPPQVNFSVNGGRDTSNNWTIDGADNLDRGANLTVYVYPSPDAIAEFKALRGQYSAEYGRNSAGQIDVVTKSGTNNFHGSAYEYFRNNYLDRQQLG